MECNYPGQTKTHEKRATEKNQLVIDQNAEKETDFCATERDLYFRISDLYTPIRSWGREYFTNQPDL